jgi:hypothetical protein
LPGAHRQSGNGARLSRASPSTPEDGRRRSRRLPREVGHWVSVSPAEGQTMFSMPLANPSTLDRRAARCASSTRLPSYVEGLWSPSLDALAGKAQDKAERIVPAYFPARGREGLSLSGGASIQFRSFQAGHHPSFSTLDSIPRRKRRPCRVALVWLAMRLGN